MMNLKIDVNGLQLILQSDQWPRPVPVQLDKATALALAWKLMRGIDAHDALEAAAAKN